MLFGHVISLKRLHGWNSHIDKIFLIHISKSIKCDKFIYKSTQTDNVSCELKEQCSFIGNFIKLSLCSYNWHNNYELFISNSNLTLTVLH